MSTFRVIMMCIVTAAALTACGGETADTTTTDTMDTMDTDTDM